MALAVPHERVASGAATAYALPSLLERVRELLAAGTLHGWASAHPDRRALGGRGQAWRVPAPAAAPEGPRYWVVRHYVRGGSVAAPLLGDRYTRAGVPRPFAELRASERARGRGVRTPRVLAAASYPAGLLFRRGDLVTEWIEGAADLARVLFEGARRSEREASLRTAGELVRELAGAGIEHVDLNAANVALRPAPDGPEAWVLDLDRARVHPEPVVGAGVRMLARLERSLARLGAASGAPLGGSEWDAFREGAGELTDILHGTHGPGGRS